jgi:hypothetical protein
LSNASVWIEDKNGNDVARFVECFDYPYNNSSDVDWYSMIMLMLFPNIEQELCQRAIDSIMEEKIPQSGIIIPTRLLLKPDSILKTIRKNTKGCR